MSITFAEHDKLELKPFSEKLERFLMVEHDFVDGSLVVSLNAPFGSGKTHFLSMWKDDLEQRRQEYKTLPLPIILNAWESDYCGDPILAVVTSLIKVIEDKGEHLKGEILREAVKDLSWLAVGMANQAVIKLTGINVIAAGAFAEEKKKSRKTGKPDFVKLYEEKTQALKKLKEALSEIFGGEKPQAFIFVDELDRCRPDYAINYLETIKHVFDVHGLVFVLAVDYDQLSCSARALFGKDLNFVEYFSKFVNREFSLPEPSRNGLGKLTYYYVSKYLENGRRFSLMKTDDLERVIELIEALAIKPRQMQKMFRIIGHTMACEEIKKGRGFWCLVAATIFMSALKATHPKTYHSIGKSQSTHLDIGNFLTSVFGRGNSSTLWWFCVYLTGVMIDGDESINMNSLLQTLNLSESNNACDLQGFFRGWSNYACRNPKNRFEEIYKMMEGANSF